MTEGTVVSRPTAPSYGLRQAPAADAGRRTLAVPRIELLVATISLLVFSYRFWAPSPWRDEAVTIDVTHRSWGELARMLGHVDLVHAAHYVLMKALFGEPGLVQMRFVSVLAATGTAVLLVRLGRALGSPLLGAGTAAIFITLPLASRYAQEARSYATVTLLVTAATLVLVHACRSDGRGLGPRLRWLAYGLLIVSAAVFHVFSVLVLPVHAVYVLAQARPALLLRWLHTAFWAGAALLPLAYLAFGQRSQVSWIPPTQNTAVWLFVRDTFASPLLALALVLGAVYLAFRGRLGHVHVLGLAWALLPAAQLYAISTQEPLFVLRYLAFSVPGAALAIAAVAIAIGEDVAARLARRVPGVDGRAPAWHRKVLHRRAAVVLAVAATAVAGLGMHIDVRRTGLGHTENVRGAVELVDRVGYTGDAVLFIPYDLRGLAQAYPDAFAGLDDVALKRSAVETASLFGTDVREDTLRRRLDGHQRVVVLARVAPPVSKIDSVKLAALAEGFRQVSRIDAWPFQVMVFERRY